MRRIDVIALTFVLVVTSAGVTYYVATHPLRRGADERIEIGVQEPIQKLSPRDILRPPNVMPPGGEGIGAETTHLTTAPQERRTIIVYPPWKAGSTRVEGAYAVTKPGNYIGVLWSPLGLDIAFTRADRAGIWIAGPNTSEARQISDDKLGDLDFSWTPDGMQLYITAIDRRPVALMLTGERYPAPEMPKRVYEREGNIYVLDEEGTPWRITSSQDRFTDPKLSPDERLVVYTAMETGLYISTVDGKKTINVGKGENPSWLPDSSGIVYDIPLSDGLTIIDGDLWFAAADGSERSNLTNTPGIVESYPAVSPDGGRIAFVAEGAVYVGKFVRGKR
ncbi:MAG: TolB family protein [Candidatus Sumerlaeaceae bacterium]